MSSVVIQELVTAFTASTDGIEKAFASVDKMGDRFGKSFSAFEEIATGAFRRVGEMAVNAVGSAINEIADLGKSVIETGINFNAMQENATTAFTTMLGSGEKAKSFLDDLQAFAAKTPFEFPDLVQSSQRLLAMGFSADKVLPTMTAIGDAVAGLGGGKEMIERVTTAFGQINAKGKTSAEEMNQLTEAGIPAWQMLADKIGKSVPEAMAMVTKGSIDAKTTIDAVTAGMEAKFGGMMEKQSHTWTGLISNLQDSFGQMSGKVIKPLFDVLEKGLSWLVDFTSSEQFTAGIDSFVESFTTGIGYVTSAIERFASVFSVQISILTSGNSSWGEKMLAVWDMLYQTGMGIWQSLLDGIVALVPQWLSNLGTWGQALWKWIVDNTPAALAKLGEWASGLWGWIVDNTPGWISTLGTWAVALWQWIVDVTPIAIAKLAELGGYLMQGITAWAFSMGPVVSDLWNILNNLFMAGYGLVTGQWDIFWSNLNNVATNFNRTIGPMLAEMGRNLWQWIATNAPIALDMLGGWWTSLTGWIGAKAPQWRQTLNEWGKGIWQWIVDATPATVTALGSWLLNIGKWSLGATTSFYTMVYGWGTALWTWIGEAIPKAIDSLTTFMNQLTAEGNGNGMSSLWEMVKPWIEPLWQWVEQTFGPLATAFVGYVEAIGTAGAKILVALGKLAVAFAPILWEWIVDVTPTAIAKLGEWAGALWGWVTSNAPQWLATLGTWAAAAWQWLVDVTPVVVGKLAEWGAAIWNWVTSNAPQWVSTLATWGVAAWNWIVDVTPTVVGKIVEWGKAIWQWVTSNAPGWVDTLAKWGGIAWQWVVDITPTVVKKIGEWGKAIWDWVIQNLPAWEANLAKWAGAAWQWLVDAVVGTISKANEWRDALFKFIEDNGPSWAYKLGEWAGTLARWVVDSIPKLIENLGIWWGKLVGWISEKGPDAASDMKDWGLDMIQGLWDGVVDKWNEFTAWWGRIWTSFKSGFQATFQMHSPSRVFADYGKNMMAGLAGGIDGAKSMVFGAMDGMSAGLDANMSANYAYTPSSSVSSDDRALMQRNNQLLEMLVRTLQDKKMTANVTVAGGGMGLGSLVSTTNGLR